MKLFLTSSAAGFVTINGISVLREFARANGFLNLLKKQLISPVKCIVMASDPQRYAANDAFASSLGDGFLIDGFQLERVEVCDSRNSKTIVDRIDEYNVVFLAGGHVPTQNLFFKSIDLKSRLKNYDGVVIGRSAGSMNCADIVYAQPELVGEAIDPNYERYLDGLGLINFSIIPHFEFIKDEMLDGLDIVKDICLPDSKIRPFYALINNSFIYSENGCSTLFGEAYFFKDGGFDLICWEEKSIDL